MKILFCKIGWMKSYQGSLNERPVNGGKFNKDNIGYEVHNYLGHNGEYYGFVEMPGKILSNSIHIEKIGDDYNEDYIDDVLVIWVATKPTGGQYVVGWYNHARVYRKLQTVPEETMSERELKDHNIYNIFSKDVFLIEPNERTFKLEGMGQSNIWYGNEKTNLKVKEYVEKFGSDFEERVNKIEAETKQLEGKEKLAMINVRVNQDKFRTQLLNKYKKCCLCSVSNQDFLIASHIKPWRDSDTYEKLAKGNGLLLCPNHDKLFDQGYISFDEKGKILISDLLKIEDKFGLNVSEDMSIQIDVENEKYILYHRNHVFKKN